MAMKQLKYGEWFMAHRTLYFNFWGKKAAFIKCLLLMNALLFIFLLSWFFTATEVGGGLGTFSNEGAEIGRVSVTCRGHKADKWEMREPSLRQGSRVAWK